MQALETLIDQERPLGVLNGIFAGGDIPHAFLFTGMDGVGKRTAARRFAMACNCGVNIKRKESISDGRPPLHGSAPCGECQSCAAMLAGSHPDLIFIEPEGNVIKIARIRELLHRITFKPFEAIMRAVIIARAGSMNREASNALLKALEEPPPQTVFFLTAAHPSDLLPTVVSRCQHVRFNPVSAETMETYLQTRAGVNASTAKTVALLSGGSMATALAMAEKPDDARLMANRRQWLLQMLNDLPGMSVPMVFAVAEVMAKDTKWLAPSLDIIKSYLRDAVIIQNCPSGIINTDMRDQIQAMTASRSREQLLVGLDAVMDMEAGLQNNGNPRLLMENLAMQLART
ncbi:MAG: DNA polymerase III subunit delta' [Thermodesulfobacteriota bacterium]|nr:DNA polymerase III subunit delta' [Thermodesulfobacteriota bacterium]